MSDSENKIYVGGLPPETAEEALRANFRKYGEIVDCIVMVDKGTNRSRGFGFVTFGDSSAVNAALGTANFVDGREVSCKKAMRDVPKEASSERHGRSEAALARTQDSGGLYNTVKIFVGGLPSSCDYDKLTGYFSRFGDIQDAVVMMDQQTQRHRGFGYVTFSETTAVEAALQMYPENKIDGKWVEVKRCIPQESMRYIGGGSTSGSSRGKGPSKGYDGRTGGCAAPVARSGPGIYDAYADPYAAYRYGSADPYGYGAAYGMYPHMPHPGYAMPQAYGMGYPHNPYGAYGARYAGYHPY